MDEFAMEEYCARGIGEIGLAGIAPAITAAVRSLPVRIEDMFATHHIAWK